MMHVLDCPCNDGCRILVSFESLKFMKTFDRLLDEDIDPTALSAVAADF